MKTFYLTIVAFLSLSCTTENIEEIISKNNQSKRMKLTVKPTACEKKIRLQFDTEDLVINFGQGWQNQSVNTFQLEWLDDMTLKINSFYAINFAEMQQSLDFSYQNYQISYTSSHTVTVSLNQPSLWYIYGEHYQMFNLNLNVDYCKPNQQLMISRN